MIADMRQFQFMKDLTSSVLEEWYNLELEFFINLSESMLQRCTKILRHDGRALDY